jgi:transglycosylase-like protein with SLT domain
MKLGIVLNLYVRISSAVGDYQSKLSEQIASIPSRVKTAKAVYAKYGSLINKYRGGAPAGLIAAIIAVESGGNEKASGDPRLGEYGLMQTASYTEKDFGVPEGTRFNTEGGVFLGLLHLNAEARHLSLKYPAYISNGALDNWLLARASFALGRYGMTSRLEKAIKAGYVSFGNAYSGLVRYLNDNEAGTKEWYRIRHIGDVQKAIASEVKSFDPPGEPQEVPAFVPYRLPKGIIGKMGAGVPIIAIVAIGVAAFLFFRG